MRELIHSDFDIEVIYASDKWLLDNQDVLEGQQIEQAEKKDLERMSYFKSASPVVALAHQKKNVLPDYSLNWQLALDGINDPGNLGTIIRIADWYGIKQILCSSTTVDLYNPKTISSTMGSFGRVDLIYGNLEELLDASGKPLYYALMQGQSVVSMDRPTEGVIVIGSEAHGISEGMMSLDHQAITIPRVGTAESLNAGIATAIVCDRFIQTA